jgi:hypothetical protein
MTTWQEIWNIVGQTGGVYPSVGAICQRATQGSGRGTATNTLKAKGRTHSGNVAVQFRALSGVLDLRTSSQVLRPTLRLPWTRCSLHFRFRHCRTRRTKTGVDLRSRDLPPLFIVFLYCRELKAKVANSVTLRIFGLPCSNVSRRHVFRHGLGHPSRNHSCRLTVVQTLNALLVELTPKVLQIDG